MTPALSKSRYLAGRQCPLRLWYETHQRELASPRTASEQFILDRGTRIGELACGRYPGGQLIAAGPREGAQALAATAAALPAGGPPALFEPAFEHDRVLVRVDVLVRTPGEAWDLVEVKSGTHVKAVHHQDVALQHWVLRGAGVPLRRTGVLTLDREYVYDGRQLDLQRLFRFHDLTDEVLAAEDEVAEQVADLQAVLAGDTAPDVSPGDQCHTPYECQFREHCTAGLERPAHPLTELPRLTPRRRAELAATGAVAVGDVPADAALTELQRRVWTAVRSGQEYVGPGLGSALTAVTHPVHHLDFEAMLPAVPRFAGTRPYDAIPFQWSDHVEAADGTLSHREYLCTHHGDPRAALARELVAALGTAGTICTYSAYEATTIRGLAEALPAQRDALLALLPRCWDLAAVIRRHYYHPGFHGSFSIKQVLPVLVPELGYADLVIGEGQAAAIAYEQTLDSEDAAASARVYQALREYCQQDTLAMVRLRQALHARA